MSISGNEVREEHERHAALKFVADDVSIRGNEVREEQLNHA